MVALHNFGADSCIVPIQLDGRPAGLHPRRPARRARPSTKLDAEGRIEVGLDGYGYRWLRLRRPEDEPII